MRTDYLIISVKYGNKHFPTPYYKQVYAFDREIGLVKEDLKHLHEEIKHIVKQMKLKHHTRADE